jgi:endonuclease V-like protein UPF0215 family
MRVSPRPHVLGIDDGPFEKFESETTPIVGVMMEGPDLVEAVAVTRFGIDGEDVTGFLAEWIAGLRFRPALHAVIFGGITIAGLGVLDIEELARRTGVPVVVVNRRERGNARVAAALETAGLAHRKPILERAPPAFRVEGGLFAAQAGADPEKAAAWIRATRSKSDLPEPLRLAHLVARAVASGESRGRP